MSWAAVAMAMGAGAGQAAAQARAVQAPGTALDAVMVTAQKRPQNLGDVPISLGVLEGATLQARAIPDMEGALAGLPNADITRTRNSGTEWNIAIRGVSNAAALNVDDSVAVYIDDVFVSDSSGFNFEFFDLASLELLRGPQGTLYGRNALGGALNIRTTAPGETFGGRVNALYGSDNEVRLGGAVDLPTTDGRLRTRIAGLYARHDARIENRFPGARDVDSLDAYGLRLRSTYDVSDRTKVEVGADYARTRRRLGGGDMAVVDDDGVNLRFPIASRLKNGGASLRIDHDAGDVRFRSISAYRATKGLSGGSRPETILNNLADLDVDQHSLSQEIQLLSAPDGRLTWIVGAFAQDYVVRRESSLDSLDYGLSERSRSRIGGTSLGLFGQGRWAISPRLAVALGARYTHDRKRFHYVHAGSLAPIFGVPFAPAQTIRQTRDWSGLTPEAVLEYHPGGGTMLYAKVNRGYKAGGFNTEFIAVQRPDFGKETLWNYEAGVKADLLDGRGRLSAAIFRSDWDDQQVLNFFNGQSHVANSQRSRTQGGEVELTFRPIARLTLTGGFGYSDATFVRFANADPFGNAADGKRQPRASRYSGALGAQYDIDLAAGWAGFARADYSYRSNFYWDALNTLREPARRLVDLGVGVSRGGVTARLFVRNATDQKYHLHAYAASPGFFPAQATPADRRTFGVSLEQTF